MPNSLNLLNIYLEALVKKLPNVEFKIKDADTIIATYEKYTVHISLDNLRRDFESNQNNIDELIERHANSLAETFQSSSKVDLSRIIPIIKSKEYLNEIQANPGFDNADYLKNCVYDLYNDELIIVYAEDTDTSIRHLFQKDIEHINFEEGALRALAIQNIDRMLTSIKKKGADGIYFLVAGGDYEASIILLDGIVSKDNFDVDGDIVIAIPNRDMLLITGSNDVKNISKMKEIAADTYNNGSYNLSQYLFKWNGEKFIKFDSIFE